MAIAAVTGAVVAATQGVFDSIIHTGATPAEGVSASASRLKGAKGIDVGELVDPGYWWVGVPAEVWTQISVDIPAPTSSTSTGSTDPLIEGQVQRVLVPASLLFDADSAVLSAKATDSLKAIATTVQDPSLPIVVVCHASADGPVSARQPLSEQRADALATALEALLGRPSGSIERIGKGDTEPLAGVDQSTPQGLAMNRRCEVFLQLPS